MILAIKPTIYKMRIALSDLERGYYDALNLTIALHPSETHERMIARVMALCLNAKKDITFTKGLSAVEEPDIWIRELDETISLWVDVGEPAPDRVKKASRQAKKMKVYTFNTKSEAWWTQSKSKIEKFAVDVIRFDWEQMKMLATHLERTSDWSVTITGQTAFVATSSGEVEVVWDVLQESN